MSEEWHVGDGIKAAEESLDPTGVSRAELREAVEYLERHDVVTAIAYSSWADIVARYWRMTKS